MGIDKASLERIELKPMWLGMVRAGRKTSTIRRGRRDIPLGSVILHDADDEIIVDVAEVVYKRFGALGSYEAETEGFDSVNELCAVLGHLYPALEDDVEMTVVHFHAEAPF